MFFSFISAVPILSLFINDREVSDTVFLPFEQKVLVTFVVYDVRPTSFLTCEVNEEPVPFQKKVQDLAGNAPVENSVLKGEFHFTPKYEYETILCKIMLERGQYLTGEIQLAVGTIGYIGKSFPLLNKLCCDK